MRVALLGAPVAVRAEEDDRGAAQALDAADRRRGLEAVDARHAHVEQDRGVLVLQHLAQRLFTRARAVQTRAQILEQRAQREQVLRLVVDQQQLHSELRIRPAMIGCSAMRRSRFATNASAPAASAAMRSAIDSFSDITTTRQAGWRLRIRRAASMPLSPGSSRLITARSSAACSARRRASSRLRASRSLNGGKEVRSQSRSALRISSCSSTSSTEGSGWPVAEEYRGWKGLTLARAGGLDVRILGRRAGPVSRELGTTAVGRTPTVRASGAHPSSETMPRWIAKRTRPATSRMPSFS